MKLWTVTTDDRNGTETNVFLTEAEADTSALAWCRMHWSADFDGPMPEDWREAYETLEQGEQWMWVKEHELDTPLTKPEVELHALDPETWLPTVWAALGDLEALRGTDEGMDDVKSAMAYLYDSLGIEADLDEPEQLCESELDGEPEEGTILQQSVQWVTVELDVLRGDLKKNQAPKGFSWAGRSYKGERVVGEVFGLLLWDHEEHEGDILLLSEFDGIGFGYVSMQSALGDWKGLLSREAEEVAEADRAAYIAQRAAAREHEAAAEERHCADCGKPAVDEWDENTPLCRDCHMNRQDEEFIE